MSVPLETQNPPLAANCLVCGIPFSGLVAVFLRWRGIRGSSRNPNCCTQCGAHLEEGRLVEVTVVFADLSSFAEMTGRLGAMTTHSVVDEFLRLASTTFTSHGGLIDNTSDGAGVSHTDLLQETRQRRTLRGVGTATTLVRGHARGLRIAAVGFFKKEAL
jgi:hypothetical protein